MGNRRFLRRMTFEHLLIECFLAWGILRNDIIPKLEPGSR